MHLRELINPHDLDAAIEAKLVNVRYAEDGQRIYNYSDAAMWTPGAWDNPAVRQCRGLITNSRGRIVARPWAKFFNHGQAEAGALDLDAAVEVTDKADGSLGIIHRSQSGSLRVATRGSFTSDQAVHATALLHRKYPGLVKTWRDDLTVLVEIVYPDNRIVCDYGDTDDLILLGGVFIDTGVYAGPNFVKDMVGWTGPVVETFHYKTLREALAADDRAGMEGLCVRYLHRSHIVKIKYADYVALHRIVTGLSERTVWDHMVTGRPLTDLLDGIPDELIPWVEDVWWQLTVAMHGIADDAEARHDAILAQLSPGFARGEYAALAKGSSLTPYLFHLLDGRDPRPAILRTLRPSGDTRAKTITEDAA